MEDGKNINQHLARQLVAGFLISTKETKA